MIWKSKNVLLPSHKIVLLHSVSVQLMQATEKKLDSVWLVLVKADCLKAILIWLNSIESSFFDIFTWRFGSHWFSEMQIPFKLWICRQKPTLTWRCQLSCNWEKAFFILNQCESHSATTRKKVLHIINVVCSTRCKVHLFLLKSEIWNRKSHTNPHSDNELLPSSVLIYLISGKMSTLFHSFHVHCMQWKLSKHTLNRNECYNSQLKLGFSCMLKMYKRNNKSDFKVFFLVKYFKIFQQRHPEVEIS